MASTIALLLATCLALAAAFNNPILDPGQDPCMKYWNGNYYLIQSAGGIRIYRSSRLEDIARGEQKVVWDGCCEIWAPELVQWDDRWYIYFARDDGNNANHKMWVLESDGSDPFGNYHEVGQITTPGDHWSIDATVLNVDGQRYFIWSGWPEFSDGLQALYIAHMSSPSSIDSDRTVISWPDQPFETNGMPINEGPAVLQHGGRTFVVYSASGSWTDDYCFGMVEYTGGDPLNQGSWRKFNGCQFAKNSGTSVYGPGHNSFTDSPDGSQVWNVYHGNQQSGSGWNGRSIRAQTVNFDGNGTPQFGVPAGFGDWIDPPSGE